MAVLYGYMQFGEQMLVEKWGYSEKTAAIFTALPWLSISIVSPFFGMLMDRIGNRVTFS